jgi:hypothetical protein
MFAMTPVASFNAVLAPHREMALENAMIAQRTPIVINHDFGRAVIVDLSPAALAFPTFGNRDDIGDDIDTFLFAELLETMVAAQAAAVNQAIVK